MKSARTANREMPLRDRPDGGNRRPVLPARVVYALIGIGTRIGIRIAT